MEVTNKISSYEIDGKENTDEIMEIKSHWNRDECVILKIGKKEVTVSAEDLKNAIINATNWKD